MYIWTFQIREVISRNIIPLQKRVINEKLTLAMNKSKCYNNTGIGISFFSGNRE